MCFRNVYITLNNFIYLYIYFWERLDILPYSREIMVTKTNCNFISSTCTIEIAFVRFLLEKKCYLLFEFSFNKLIKQLELYAKIHKITLHGIRKFCISWNRNTQLFSHAVVLFDYKHVFEKHSEKQAQIPVLSMISENICHCESEDSMARIKQSILSNENLIPCSKMCEKTSSCMLFKYFAF